MLRLNTQITRWIALQSACSEFRFAFFSFFVSNQRCNFVQSTSIGGLIRIPRLYGVSLVVICELVAVSWGIVIMVLHLSCSQTTLHEFQTPLHEFQHEYGKQFTRCMIPWAAGVCIIFVLWADFRYGESRHRHQRTARPSQQREGAGWRGCSPGAGRVPGPEHLAACGWPVSKASCRIIVHGAQCTGAPFDQSTLHWQTACMAMHHRLSPMRPDSKANGECHTPCESRERWFDEQAERFWDGMGCEMPGRSRSLWRRQIIALAETATALESLPAASVHAGAGAVPPANASCACRAALGRLPEGVPCQLMIVARSLVCLQILQLVERWASRGGAQRAACCQAPSEPDWRLICNSCSPALTRRRGRCSSWPRFWVLGGANGRPAYLWERLLWTIMAPVSASSIARVCTNRARGCPDVWFDPTIACYNQRYQSTAVAMVAELVQVLLRSASRQPLTHWLKISFHVNWTCMAQTIASMQPLVSDRAWWRARIWKDIGWHGLWSGCAVGSNGVSSDWVT